MMLWFLPVTPMVLGVLLWCCAGRLAPTPGTQRLLLGLVSVVGLAVTLALAVWSGSTDASATLPWGAGWALTLEVRPDVAIASVLVPMVSLAVVSWAAAHEADRGLARLIGLLLTFAGAMELLVLAADLLTLSIAWELVSVLSWALIGHRWRASENMDAAAYAFNATRFGGLGLWLAAGASLAVTGGLRLADLPLVATSPWGHWLAAGVLLAAATKSAQGPFAPWLFRAMEGPSSVSALLHSSTMVAAGAWLLIRLHEPLGSVPWFGPATIGLGLATALAGGFVAAWQGHAKRLLAASTSAQYGLMFAAVGAGFAGVGLTHLVTHAVFKSLLFLVAGTAIAAAGSEQLRDMGLGRRLPAMAGASAVGALSLAAVPPLGGAWSKEQIVAALGHEAPWLAVLAMAAGALSAWYAVRFHVLAYGRGRDDDGYRANAVERIAVWSLAALAVVLGFAWLPAGEHLVAAHVPGTLPPGKPWELALSLVTVVLTAVTAWIVHHRAVTASTRLPPSIAFHLGDWLGLPTLVRLSVITPIRSLAGACARFDDRVVDAGVRATSAAGRAFSRFATTVLETDIDGLLRSFSRGALKAARTSRVVDDGGIDGLIRVFSLGGLQAARASRVVDDGGIDAAVDGMACNIGRAAGHSRRLQTGALPTYYSLLVAGAFALMLALALWR